MAPVGAGAVPAERTPPCGLVWRRSTGDEADMRRRRGGVGGGGRPVPEDSEMAPVGAAPSLQIRPTTPGRAAAPYPPPSPSTGHALGRGERQIRHSKPNRVPWVQEHSTLPERGPGRVLRGVPRHHQGASSSSGR